jgi:hypothetical protein
VPAGPRATLAALRPRVLSALAPHAHRIAIGGFCAAVLTGVVVGGVVGTSGDAGPAQVTSAADRSERASRDFTRTAPATPLPVPPAKPSPTPTKSTPAAKAPPAKAPPAKAPSRPAASKPAPKPPVPVPASCASYRGNKRIACSLLPSFGFSTAQMPALDKLWAHESGWNVRAANRSSGAYGIPQALPGSKMARYGADWRTNPATQIKWGLSYIKGRYGTPTRAWAHFRSHGWY